jgi:outer membrane receptor protein involved in Fe transport
MERSRFVPSACLCGSVLLLALFVFDSRPVLAQGTAATLTGVVSDPSGAPVPNARVAIENVDTGIVSSTTTDAKGFYSVTNLQPGTYDVTTVATGFSTTAHSGIALTVGATQQLNISLHVGQVKQIITVTAATPTVQLASSSISGVVDQDAVVTLPLNGRDWTLLATLQPGVNTISTQQPVSSNGVRGNRGYGNEITLSGTRPQENNYLIDGVSVVDYAASGPGNVGGYALGVDAISEFSVITANSSAEYGRTAGGIITAVTRSGANQFHGEAFGFLRSGSLDAPGFFDNGTVPPFHRDQFGGSLGGPIRRKKTFFFIDYEGFRQGQGTSSVNIVPSLTARQGLLLFPNGAFPATSNPATNCVPTGVANQCQVQIDPVVAQYLNFWPTPSASAPVLGDGNTAQVTQTNNNVVHENFITGRIDNHFSDRDSLSGTYLYQNGFNNQPDPLNTVLFGNQSTQQVLSLQETHVFSPSFTNTARIGFNRVTAASTYTVSAINPLAAQDGLGAFGRQAATIFAGSLTPFNGGIDGATILYDFWNSYQADDDAFLVKGDQSIRFGFSVERDQHNSRINNTGNGQFSFGSLYDFLTNQPNVFTGSPSGFTHEGLRQTIFGLYVQDDWKIAPRLTLNLGLRYQMSTVPTAVNNQLVNLRVPTSPTPFLGSPLFSNPTLKNFEPRLGFAWDPFGTGNTAVRGAFGMFDVLPLTSEFFVMQQQSAPYALVITKSASPSLPQGSFPAGFNDATASASDLQSTWIEPNPKRDYVMIWNLNIQRQITPSISAMIGYVGNHEVHAYNRVDDYNTVIPTLTPVGVLFPSPAGSGTKLNPNVGSIRAGYWTGSAVYNSLQATVTKTLSRGLQAQASYTWGKDIDTGSATDIGDPFRNSISSPYAFWPGRRGPSDFNIAQNFVINFIWNVPTPKGWHEGVLGHTLSGWQMNGIFTILTGLPFTAVITPDPVGANSGDPWDFPDVIPGCKTTNPGHINYVNLSCFALPSAPAPMAAQCSPSSWPGAPAPPPAGRVYCQNLLGNEGRNSIIGPGSYTLDFSIFKNNYIRRISENFNIQMRAEFFNLTNHASFLSPIDNQALFDSSGAPIGGAGTLDQLQVPAREIQFGLKVIF